MHQKDWDKEHKKLIAEEKAFLKAGKKDKKNFLTQKVEQYVPESVCDKLNAAFVKGFELVFSKGAPIVEKTYSKTKYEEDFKIHRFTMETRKRNGLSGFKKKANSASRRNILISGAEGACFGVLGIGLPDIPVFIGVLMKTVQEIALSYGYDYNTEEEKIFMLKLIRTAMSQGEFRIAENRSMGKLICGIENETRSLNEEIAATAKVLSDRLLYLKFIQGIPLVGLVGGLSDFTVTKEISGYARLVYKKRFLRKLWKEREGQI